MACSAAPGAAAPLGRHPAAQQAAPATSASQHHGRPAPAREVIRFMVIALLSVSASIRSMAVRTGPGGPRKLRPPDGRSASAASEKPSPWQCPHTSRAIRSGGRRLSFWLWTARTSAGRRAPAPGAGAGGRWRRTRRSRPPPARPAPSSTARSAASPGRRGCGRRRGSPRRRPPRRSRCRTGAPGGRTRSPSRARGPLASSGPGPGPGACAVRPSGRRMPCLPATKPARSAAWQRAQVSPPTFQSPVSGADAAAGRDRRGS